MFIIFFFFSSRRRHTRLQGDWSSDVCSSDLTAFLDAMRAEGLELAEEGRSWKVQGPTSTGRLDPLEVGKLRLGVAFSGRSEERRVGKGVDLGGRRIIKKKKKSEREERADETG